MENWQYILVCNTEMNSKDFIYFLKICFKFSLLKCYGQLNIKGILLLPSILGKKFSFWLLSIWNGK
jgi:hypothetical protein